MPKATAIPHKRVAERLRKRREALGLSQRNISTPGCSYAYISRIESGSRRPSLEALIALAAKLGMTGLELLTGNREARCPLCQRDGHHPESG